MKMTLFWRLFLATLSVLLLTAILSTFVERWFIRQAIHKSIDTQMVTLLQLQQNIAQALQTGNKQAAQKIYAKNQKLGSQIIVIDAKGEIILPTSRQRIFPPHINFPHHKPRGMETFIQWTKSELPPALQVTTQTGEKLTVEIIPRLVVKDILQARGGYFSVRLGLLLTFSILVCFLISHSLSSRIRHLQQTVYQISRGKYQRAQNEPTGSDELSALAQDIEHLAERLQRSENARRQMLSDISHELCSPLARMDVAAELITERAPQIQSYLERIQKDIYQMKTLIADIIKIQSLQLNQVENLEKTTFDLTEIIAEIGRNACFEYQKKSIEWIFDLHGKSLINADKMQLSSALENIIRNAFKHSPEKGTVSVKIEHHPTWLHIRVLDEGGGISPTEDLERIFLPFVRLDQSRHRKTGGHGLGLAIAKAIIEAHEGQIWAKNRSDGVLGLEMNIKLLIDNKH